MKKWRLLSFVFLLTGCVFLMADENAEKLLEAVRKSDVPTVKQLLEAGTDANSKGRYDVTALFFACDRGNVEVVRLLLDNGAEMNVKDTFYGATPLGWAAFNERAAVVELMLERGAEGAEDVLSSAVSRDNKEMVKAVLKKGKLSEEALSNSLQAAVNTEKGEIADMLREAGAKMPEIPEVNISPEQMKLYPGTYKNEERAFVMVFKMEDEKLIGVFGSQPPLTYRPVDEDHNFTAVEFQGINITFKVEDNVSNGFTLKQGDFVVDFQREAPAAEEVAVAEETGTEKSSSTNDFKAGMSLVKKANNWPSFRGEKASGVADGQYPPVQWNEEAQNNILWKVPIPGISHSSPVIWGDKVFITTAVSSDTSAVLRVGLYGDVKPDADVSEHRWEVYCLDRKSGKILWQQLAHQGVPQVKRHTKATQSNSTPVTDGQYLVALFGAEGMYCYDMDGKLLWKKDLGFLDAGWFFDPDYHWGHASSPIIYKDMVIVQCDRQKDSYLAAYKLKDGSEVWKVAREEIPSWASPTVYEGETGAELLTNATNGIRAYNPLTGEEKWVIHGNSEIAVPTPIIAHDLIYITSGYRPIQPIYVIRPGGEGDLTLPDSLDSSEQIVWRKKRGGPYMPTPIVYGDNLYICANNGTLTCLDAKTGEQHYRERLGGRGSGYAFTASPLAADGRLYFFSEDGETYVVKAGNSFEHVSTNEIDEVIMATPAISGGILYIRAENSLYAIAKP